MKPWKVWHKIRDFLKFISSSSRKAVPVMVLGSFAKASVPFLNLYFSAQILNAMIAGNREMCITNVGILLLSQLVAGSIEKICTQATTTFSEGCERDIERRMTEKAYELQYEEYEKQETMDTIRRTFISAMGNGGISDQMKLLYEVFEESFRLIYAVIFLGILFFKVAGGREGGFLTSPASTILLLLFYAGMFLVCARLEKKRRNIYDEMSRGNDHNNSMFSYLVSMMRNEKNGADIRVFQMQPALKEKWDVYGNAGTEVYMKAGKGAGKESSKKSFISQLEAAAAYIYVGVRAFYGMIGVGEVLLYAGAINNALDALNRIISKLGSFDYRADYLKTFDAFLSRPAMSYDGTLPIEKRDDGAYEFEFHDVSFCYPGTTDEVLSHVSLRFGIGEKTALVGKNGAGKTTFIKLLCRLYEPTSGYITLNGIDIRKYNYKEYTTVFSVVFQDFEIFSLPLGENVAGSETVDEARVWETLKEVALKERVERMEDGIHSQLYNNNGKGIDLSGGEAQRAAIARALYKDAPFVILDEPTTALDPIAEAEIYENFNEMVARKTAIYISHRMSSCKFCDNIVVLDHGTIKERGKHEQLLAQKGIYAELYETQAQYYA